MPNADAPPDNEIRDVLSAFAAGRIDRMRACRDLIRIFGRGSEVSEGRLSELFDDLTGRRITMDEARRDLIRAATAARRGDSHYLALLSPMHA